MGQGQSAPSGIPASAAAAEPVAPKRANSPSPSQSVPNVLSGQTGGKGSRHLRQKIRNKHMKSRKNRSNRRSN